MAFVSLPVQVDGITLQRSASGVLSVKDGGVDTTQLADGALSADATGRAKTEDGYTNAVKVAADVATQAELEALGAFYQPAAYGVAFSCAASSTEFRDMGGATTAEGATDAAVATGAPRAMTLKGLSCYATSAGAAGAGATWTLYKNGVATALTFFVARGAALAWVHVNADVSVAAGDTLSLQCVNAANGVAAVNVALLKVVVS